jgi:formylglycine-generating enzyme required for sulfatase activity
MAGNVYEWTSSNFQDYPYDQDDGREDPEGNERRTLCGGSWDTSENRVRCAYRGWNFPHLRYDRRGFRVVVVVAPGS